jgi:hypothetical protein
LDVQIADEIESYSMSLLIPHEEIPRQWVVSISSDFPRVTCFSDLIPSGFANPSIFPALRMMRQTILLSWTNYFARDTLLGNDRRL